nr:BspA family leucine-rich repeat surface protein [Bacilli bacterium]
LSLDVDFIIDYNELGTNKKGVLSINPKTGDNIYIRGILLVVSSIGLIICLIDKKKTNKKLLVVGLLLVSPMIVKAATHTFDIVLVSEYKLNDRLIVKYINGEEISSKIVDYNTKVDEPKNINDPTNGAKTFAGWFTKDNKKFDFDDEVVEDTVLTAKWVTTPTLNILLSDKYYIGSNVVITSNAVASTENYNIVYKYLKEGESEYITLTNLNELTEGANYKIVGTLTDDNGLIAIDEVDIEITAPTLNINFDDNKERNHYWNKDIKLLSEITNNEYDITEVKFYYTSGKEVTSTDGNGNSNSKNVEYSEIYYELNNLKGLPIGEYRIKMVAKDTINNVFEIYKDTTITYGSFDFSRGFTVTRDNTNIITKTNVQSVKFVDGIGSLDLENDTNYQDISEDQDNGVIEWWVKDDTTGLYDIYIGGQYSHLVQSSTSSIKGLLQGYTNLKSVDFEYFYTGNLINVSYLFNGDSKLNNVNWGTNWDTSTFVDVSYMFNDCAGFKTLDLNDWNTGNIKTMTYTFNNMSNLEELHVEEWDTSSLERITAGFMSNNKLTTLDLNKWDVRKLKALDGAFQNNHNLVELKVSNWDTPSLLDLGFAFRGLNKIEVLDLSNWTLDNVQQIHRAFSDDSKLREIKVNKPVVFRANGGDFMFGYAFNGCSKLNFEFTIYATSVRAESTQYGKSYALAGAATAEDAQITIHYNNASKKVFNKFCSTKSSSSHIVGINDDEV